MFDSATTRRLLRAGALAFSLTLAAAACGGDDEGKVVADVLEDGALPTGSTVPPPLPSAAGKECVEPVDATEFEGKPAVEMPVGEVPTELATNDITAGDGAEAVDGKALSVNYVGVACSTGVEFDTSWAEGREPLALTLGQGMVIPGWEEGLVGMKVGGVRRIIIPAEKGYGDTGSGDKIAPGEALVFVVELLEVTDPPAEGAETPAEGAEAPAEGAETPAEGAETPAEGEGSESSEPAPEG